LVLLGLKKNQPKLYAAVEKYAQTTGTHLDNLVSDYFDKSHGRCVRRRCFAFDVTEEIAKLGFSKMNTIIATETISKSDYEDKVSAQWRYYITDHNKSQPKLAKYIRDHWQIESMHWLLDVHLNDDKDKKYEENAAENFAKTKRLLLNLVKSKPPQGKKSSIRSNLKRVGWDLDYLVALLFG
jgi:predicted transposase YbfD/YdcC